MPSTNNVMNERSGRLPGLSARPTARRPWPAGWAGAGDTTGSLAIGTSAANTPVEASVGLTGTDPRGASGASGSGVGTGAAGTAAGAGAAGTAASAGAGHALRPLPRQEFDESGGLGSAPRSPEPSATAGVAASTNVATATPNRMASPSPRSSARAQPPDRVL